MAGRDRAASGTGDRRGCAHHGEAPRDPAEQERRARSCSTCDDLSVYYGDFRAVRDVTLPILRERDHGADRPVGLRQDHVPPLPEPDERPDRGRAGRGPGPVPRGRPLRRGRRPGRGPPPDRHGLPEAEPVPEVDLRQHRVRPEDRRVQGQHGRAGRGVASAGRPCGTRSRTSSRSRGWRCRAASSSGSASRGRSRPGRT